MARHSHKEHDQGPRQGRPPCQRRARSATPNSSIFVDACCKKQKRSALALARTAARGRARRNRRAPQACAPANGQPPVHANLCTEPLPIAVPSVFKGLEQELLKFFRFSIDPQREKYVGRANPTPQAVACPSTSVVSRVVDKQLQSDQTPAAIHPWSLRCAPSSPRFRTARRRTDHHRGVVVGLPFRRIARARSIRSARNPNTAPVNPGADVKPR